MKLSLTLFFLLISFAGFSQNELKARIAFEEGEKYFAEEKYVEALEQFNKAETFLGKWTPKIGFLKIVALDILCDYTDENDVNGNMLVVETPKYINFASKQGDLVDLEKFKTIYAIDERVRLFEQLVKESKDPEFVSGNAAYKKSEYLTALELWQKAALKKNGLAMWHIGILYDGGFGVAQSDEMKYEWYAKAAAANNVNAISTMGDREISSKNYPEAMNWHKKGAEYGNAYSMTQMGSFYLKSLGVTKDNPQAIFWYKKAAEKGETYAMNVLGLFNEGGFGGDVNLPEAMKWHQKGAGKGSVFSMQRISKMYYNGEGVVKDDKAGEEWHNKAELAKTKQ